MGRRMMPKAQQTSTGWRRVIAGVLAYTLALQGFIFVLDFGRAAIAAATDGANVTTFALCTHDGGGVTVPGTPAQAPADDMHCAFCFAGAVYVNCAAPSAPQWNKIVLDDAVWPGAAPRLVALFSNKSAWPRGPPAAA